MRQSDKLKQERISMIHLVDIDDEAGRIDLEVTKEQ